ncbi:Type IV secretory pathway, VirB4 components [Candidatus Micrarchaeum sp.]|uniref:ATP-binding protein n=1 Tax=Candidatus Micrarchaeum sp. TaxID=2282148 RepID=UPI000AEBEDC9|nr:ATP-binding protein [Candidatus Micrarchaeum sp.]QRF73940.1 Type IV secretory pathway, VirB4 components [Candidatus Micrarchaeum sp.]
MQINIAQGVDIDAQKLLTGRCCVIGQSGSGKSFLIGVIAEELSKSHLPFLIVDTEGEYVNLGKAYGLIVVGSGPEANIGLDTDYGLLFRQSIQAKKPVVMDVSDAVDPQHAVYEAVRALYDVEEELRNPYLVIIEEADKFVPQIVKSRINIIEEVSVRGRKRGIGLLVATQRPANISKNVLAQCSYGFIGKLTIENDFDSISILLENRKRMEEVAKLGTGEFLPFGTGNEDVFKVKGRSLAHVGSTPSIDYSSGTEISLESVISQLKNSSVEQRTGSKQPRQKARTTNAQEKQRAEEINVVSGIREKEELMQRLQGTKGAITRLMPKRGYSVESIDTVYVPFAYVKILVPRGKGSEYDEIEAIYDSSMREVSLHGSPKILRHAPQKANSLNAVEFSTLETLRRLKHAKSSKLAKACGLTVERMENLLISLENKGLLSFDGKEYRSVQLPKTNKRIPQTFAAKPDGMVMDIDTEKLGRIIEMNYPGCKLEEHSIFYMPFYKARLRYKNRVKISVFNSMSLKEEKSALVSGFSKL